MSKDSVVGRYRWVGRSWGTELWDSHTGEIARIPSGSFSVTAPLSPEERAFREEWDAHPDGQAVVARWIEKYREEGK